MQVSREMDYGVRAVCVLAAHSGDVLSKRTIAQDFHIPVNFLAIILPKLVHAGLVESLSGPRGGYRLARSASSISILDVVHAVDSGFALNRCLDKNRGCEEKPRCPVTSYWERLQGEVERFLSEVRFDRIAEEFRRSRVAENG